MLPISTRPRIDRTKREIITSKKKKKKNPKQIDME
jgi:hypothetical protein